MKLSDIHNRINSVWDKKRLKEQAEKSVNAPTYKKGAQTYFK
jgi:hypothetical protein